MSGALDLDDRRTQRVIGWLVVATIALGLLWTIWWGRSRDLPARAMLSGPQVGSYSSGALLVRYSVRHDGKPGPGRGRALALAINNAYGPAQLGETLVVEGEPEYVVESSANETVADFIAWFGAVCVEIDPIEVVDGVHVFELAVFAERPSGDRGSGAQSRYAVPEGIDPRAAFVPCEPVLVDLLQLDPLTEIELGRFFDVPVVIRIEKVEKVDEVRNP